MATRETDGALVSRVSQLRSLDWSEIRLGRIAASGNEIVDRAMSWDMVEMRVEDTELGGRG